MIHYFDTSVLVAAMVAHHPKNAACKPWLSRVRSGEAEMRVSQHGLLECYSVLTGTPWKPNMPPGFAAQLLDSNIPTAAIVELSERDYRGCIERAVKANLSGGAVYDLLHVVAAVRGGADRILSLNRKDFERVGMFHQIEIREP